MRADIKAEAEKRLKAHFPNGGLSDGELQRMCLQVETEFNQKGIGKPEPAKPAAVKRKP